ncbi:MAG: hypothetical protein U1A05_04315 [Alphaproteobacteria bacterium]|nr:hypothetical protein [Alphaproteobacteria bacterium]
MGHSLTIPFQRQPINLKKLKNDPGRETYYKNHIPIGNALLRTVEHAN